MSSEAVRVIRDILPGVSEQMLAELRSLVAYSLAVPSPSELREQCLGLLVEMIARTARGRAGSGVYGGVYACHAEQRDGR